MTDGTDNKTVRVNPNQAVDGFTRELALEVSTPTLVGPCRGHLLRQILQHVMRITVQPVHHVREIDNNRPSANNLDHSDRQLETLPGPGGLRNLR